MELQELSDNQIISEYIYKNRDKIPIIGVAEITKDNWGRLDKIIFDFCDGDMALLPIIMDFNRITNPFDLKIGRYIDIPDYQYLIQAIEINDSENIPGVNNSMDCLTNNQQKLKDGVNKSDNTVTAIPKLNIPFKKVTYDKTKGTLTY